jgi:tetratricopeptide (TPR) repeat protein
MQYSRTAASFQPDETVVAASKAVQLDPISARSHYVLALAHYANHEFPEAETAARRALLLDPEFPSVRGSLAIILLVGGKPDKAREQAAKEPIEWQRRTALALAEAHLGHTDLARTQLAAAIERLSDAAAYQYAQVNVALGDYDEALRWLGVARRVKDPGLSYMAFDPLLDPLRKDPRFARLLSELGLADVARDS